MQINKQILNEIVSFVGIRDRRGYPIVRYAFLQAQEVAQITFLRTYPREGGGSITVRSFKSFRSHKQNEEVKRWWPIRKQGDK